MIKFARASFLAAGVALATTAFSIPASAAQTSPETVTWVQGATGYMFLQTPSMQFVAQTAAGNGCDVQSMETMKIWMSLAQAAILSGKQIRVTYKTPQCNGQNYITAIDLIK